MVPSDWRGDVWAYNTRLDDDPTDVCIAKLIRRAAEKHGLQKASWGCDRNMETVCGTHVGGVAYVPGEPFYRLLSGTLEGARLEDQTSWLYEMRMRKTADEILALKRCNEIVDHALEKARESLVAGMKETELAAVIESSIQAYGVGYKGARRARGFAFVMSGPQNTMAAWGAYNISTDRVIREGDLVLIELDTQADGFWSDISRTFVVGRPDKKQKEVWDAVRRSQELTIKSLKVGAKISTVDEKARGILRDAGYAENFLHHIGHGVGFAFHEMPYLDPASHVRTDYSIEAGMVFAIEPGVYIEGWGGLRIEDNVYMTENGAEYLSTSGRGLTR
jgi:Xaa-Pro dipeptidase